MAGQPDWKAEKHRKRHKAVKDEWAEIRRQLLPAPCMCGCGFPATELHHLVSRAQGGDDVPENLSPLAHKCHMELEAGDQVLAFTVGFNLSLDQRRYVAEKKGEWWLRKFYGVSANGPKPVSTDVKGQGHGETSASVDLPAIPPGEKCPTCARKIPHPRKPTSPSATKPLQFGRAPDEIADEIKERVNAIADEAGLGKLPFPQARGVLLLLTLAEVVDPETLSAVAAGMSWGKREAA